MTADDPLLDLIRQIQAGIRRDEGFENLFHRFRPRIRSFFIRKGFAADESRDLTQEVFLRVFKGIDTFQGKSSFERWLWQIVDRVYLNEVRRLHAGMRSAIVLPLDGVSKNEEGECQAKDIPTDDPSPEDDFLRRQGLAVLRRELQELPDQMRRCCILRYEKGLKYQEIATSMGISIETVKAHLHQARKRLIARLGGGFRSRTELP